MKQLWMPLLAMQAVAFSLSAGGMWGDDEEDLSSLPPEQILALEETTRQEKISEEKSVDLANYAKQVYSRGGEDGVIDKLFELLGDNSGYFVEIGVAKEGQQGNALHLKRDRGWKGIILDPETSIPCQGIHCEEISADNVVSLFEKYRVPKEFNLLSIEVDGPHDEIWASVSNSYRPDVVIVPFGPENDSAAVVELTSKSSAKPQSKPRLVVETTDISSRKAERSKPRVEATEPFTSGLVELDGGKPSGSGKRSTLVVDAVREPAAKRAKTSVEETEPFTPGFVELDKVGSSSSGKRSTLIADPVKEPAAKRVKPSIEEVEPLTSGLVEVSNSRSPAREPAPKVERASAAKRAELNPELPQDLPCRMDLLSDCLDSIEKSVDFADASGYSLVLADGDSMNLVFVRTELLREKNVEVKGENEVPTLLRSIGRSHLDLMMTPLLFSRLKPKKHGRKY